VNALGQCKEHAGKDESAKGGQHHVTEKPGTQRNGHQQDGDRNAGCETQGKLPGAAALPSGKRQFMDPVPSKDQPADAQHDRKPDQKDDPNDPKNDFHEMPSASCLFVGFRRSRTRTLRRPAERAGGTLAQIKVGVHLQPMALGGCPPVPRQSTQGFALGALRAQVLMPSGK